MSSTTAAAAAAPTLSLVESSKRAAAYLAVDLHFPSTPGTSSSPLIIGIGSGSTVIYVVERILQLPPTLLSTCIFIPTGYQSRQLILAGNLRLGDIDSHSRLDVCFDGADEVDPSLNLIKGGGACLFQEKLVAIKADKFVAVADYRKVSESLGTCFLQGIPIEVVPPAVSYVVEGLRKLGLVDVTLRLGGAAKAGPVVTDNGNFILDAKVPAGGVGSSEKVEALARGMKSLVGVVEHGIFWSGDKKPVVAYFGMEDGTVFTREA